MKKISLAVGMIASMLAIAGTPCADSIVNSIITSPAPGSSNNTPQSCDPDGRQSLASQEECLDSYCSHTSLSCTSAPASPPREEAVEIVLEIVLDDDFEDSKIRVRLIDRRAFVKLEVVSPSSLKFSLFSTKEKNFYVRRAVNGIQINLLDNRISVPEHIADGDLLLIDDEFVRTQLSSLLAIIKPNEAVQIGKICKYVSDPMHVAVIIDAGLVSIRDQSNFERQYFYWKDRPNVAVKSLSDIGRACWGLAKKYS